ncbi:hypothetical protein C8Q80DRAFT_1274525 [Daedaleopsis nitida]|nr:hypothetical protein C8Q80DRAFT_1274525 [Daedaleopsis nitida]
MAPRKPLLDRSKRPLVHAPSSSAGPPLSGLVINVLVGNNQLTAHAKYALLRKDVVASRRFVPVLKAAVEKDIQNNHMLTHAHITALCMLQVDSGPIRSAQPCSSPSDFLLSTGMPRHALTLPPFTQSLDSQNQTANKLLCVADVAAADALDRGVLESRRCN